MKLLSYKSTQKGLAGIANVLIRLRLRTQISHSEILFEPGDGVDHLMPDGTTEPDENGAYWCGSSSAGEKLPTWSTRRANKTGGVRFKRVVPNPFKWYIRSTNRDPLKAAETFKKYEGFMYDWQLIIGFIVWIIPDKRNRKMCSEICAEALGFEETWRIDPAILDIAIVNENK